MAPALFVLYVADQAAARRFWAQVLARAPQLDVPGMTEFALGEGALLGLMPAAGARRLLGPALPDPAAAAGTPRAELYLRVDGAAAAHARALAAGARELSPPAERDWGERVAYSLDPDGHVLAFAEAAPAGRAKPAPVAAPVLEAVRLRWSPRAWTAEPVPAATLATLFEAARWAPSSFNEQPWRWLVAGREDPNAFALMLSCLGEWNQRWARRVGALALAVTREHFTHNEKPNHHAWYDLGQACAIMAVQAASLGLQIHQMGGIDPERARQVYGVPAGFQVVTGIGIGRQGDPATLDDEGMLKSELGPRERRPLAESVFAGRWGEPHPAALRGNRREEGP